MKKVRKAIIPAAGYGTRFLPATKALPKEMLPIIDTPTIQYIVEEAVKAGIEDIIIVTGKQKRAIEDHFDRNVELEVELENKGKLAMLEKVKYPTQLANIHYVRQKEMAGLGDAILTARSFIGDEPFAVLLGDDIVYNPEKPCLQQLMDCYEQHPGIILGAQFVPNEKVSSYGIVSGEPLADNLYRVHGLVEKPSVDKAPSNLAVLGRYILTPDIFDILENTKPGVGNEVQLTDALAASKTDTYALAYEGVRYDTGDKLGYLKATVEYALRNEELGTAFKDYLKGLNL